MSSLDRSNPNVILTGVLLAASITAVIAFTADRLVVFDIVGPTVPFAYPWRLVDPTTMARLSAWIGYALHNLFVWTIIFLARREQPKFQRQFRWYNWAMLAGNGSFVILHILQTHLFYDGLAQDVPEITALGSVALMLMIVLILETPRRGLALGKRVRFDRRFLKIVREYHGYLILVGDRLHLLVSPNRFDHRTLGWVLLHVHAVLAVGADLQPCPSQSLVDNNPRVAGAATWCTGRHHPTRNHVADVRFWICSYLYPDANARAWAQHPNSQPACDSFRTGRAGHLRLNRGDRHAP